MFTAPKTTAWNGYFTIPEGKHTAVLTELIDLGTQETNFNGEVKQKRQIRINWELPNVLHEFKEWEWAKPAYIWKTVTFSMYKSSLLEIVESIIWKTLTEEEAESFDFNTLLWSTCEMKIEHKAGRDGNNYARIFKIYDTDKKEKATNPLIAYSIDTSSKSDFDKLRPKTQEMIKASPEYQARENVDGWNFGGEPEEKSREKSELDDLPF